MSAFVSDRRLWLTADKSRVVEDGSEEAAFLLVAAGSWIDASDVAVYKLHVVDGKVVLPDAAKAEPDPEPDAVDEAEEPTAPRRKRKG